MVDREDGDNENTMVASKEFELIRRIHFENFSELGVRRYDAFLYDGLLTRYKPEYAASPLRNPKTARVFAHFIHVVSTRPLRSVLRFTSVGASLRESLEGMTVGSRHEAFTAVCFALSSVLQLHRP
jgi:hypothetical protein